MEKLSAAYLITSAAGIGLACYTAYEYITGSFSPVCSINNMFSCAGVAGSGHTSLFGIPFWTAGVVWFPLAFALGLITSKFGKQPVNSELLLPFLVIGNVFTIYLWYLELVVIHIICPFCVSLYVANYILTGIVLVRIIKTGPDEEELASSKH